jgi:hypothetical protein
LMLKLVHCVWKQIFLAPTVVFFFADFFYCWISEHYPDLALYTHINYWLS